MTVRLSADVLRRYPRFSLHNSPYTAHDAGAAVDLYPEPRDEASHVGSPAPSPVAGEVLDTRTVDAPPKPYAADHDHLILVDTGEYVARILHVDPAVASGDSVGVGDTLGSLTRSGFFAPWVDDHIHLGFRATDANPYRASGSVRVELDPALDLRPVPWDGTGTVVETGETYAVLDAPTHPAPGDCFAGLDGGACVLDGGLPHYDGGGALGGADGPVSLIDTQVGVAEDRTVSWTDPTVRVRCESLDPAGTAGDPITGLSLFCGRETAGLKLVYPDHAFGVGDRVTVTIA